MNKPARKTEWLVWGGLVLIIATIGGAFAWTRLSTATKPLPVIGQISNFSLTNQNSTPVSLADLRGQVCVADIIFTRCPGPCTKMTRALAQLQAALPPGQPVRLVSLTSDPEFDTPAKLKEYASKFGADSNRWWFLTGKKSDLRSLAVNDFKFVMLDKKPEDREVPEDLFIHSTWFVLLDRQGRLRGWTDREGKLHAYFDLDDSDVQEQILTALKQLLREPISTP
jgi:protein SCO1/2